ncbi:unnamed protein product, partial [Polarella glacialis]
TPGTAVIFMLNSLTGLSLLTMPYGFAQCGLLLGFVILLCCMGISFITATFMCEALTIANALTYEKAEASWLEQQVSAVRERICKGWNSKKLEGLEGPLLQGGRHNTSAFMDEVRNNNPMSEFKIRERVELGAMGELFLRDSRGAKALSTMIYLMVLTFTYGTAAALVVTVNQSLAHTVVSAASMLDNNESSMDCDAVYVVCVICSFCVTLPLCFTNLQKTKKYTIVIMCLRFLAIATLILVASIQSWDRLQQEGTAAVLQRVPLWRPEGFVPVFSNAVFLCGIHHYIPSMISPLEPQRLAPRVIAVAFSTCFFIIVAVCATALVAWGGTRHVLLSLAATSARFSPCTT